MTTMTSENILDNYNKQLDENEICYKNNRARNMTMNQSTPSKSQKTIVEVEYFCLECGYLKYVHNYIEDSEL